MEFDKILNQSSLSYIKFTKNLFLFNINNFQKYASE